MLDYVHVTNFLLLIIIIVFTRNLQSNLTFIRQECNVDLLQ